MTEGASRVEELEHGALTWVMVERPGRPEVAQLGARFGLHPLDVEALGSRDARPKLATRGGYTSAVLDFPVQLARPRRVALGQLHLLVGPDFVVTVHAGELRSLVRLMSDLRGDSAARAQAMASTGRLAYAIVQGLVESSDPSIGRLTTAIEALQEDVFADVPRESLRSQVLLRQEIVGLGRALRPDVEVIFAMARASHTATGDLAAYWELVGDQLQRLVDRLDDDWTTLDVVDEARAAIQRGRADDRVRALLLIAALLMPIATIGTVFGMTVRGLPGADTEWGFELAIGLMLVAVLGLVAWLRRQRLV